MQRKYARTIAPELKFYDTDVAATWNLVPQTTQLCLVGQGDTQSTRTGNQISVRHVSLHAVVTVTPVVNTTVYGYTAMYVILDKQCNGAALSYTELIQESRADLVIGQPLMANSDRFIFLAEQVLWWDKPAGIQSEGYNLQEQPIKIELDVNIPIMYSGATGALTEIRSNNICLYFVSGGNIHVQAVTQGRARIRFYG